jgi:hypothetical protein
MGDDAIALNCPEGYSGNISRVTVSNCTFNSWSLMRVYTIASSGGPAFIIDTVKVSNCSGTLAAWTFLIGTGSGSKPNSVTSLTVSDCSFTAPAVIDVAANYGTVALNNVTLTPLNSNKGLGFAFVRTSENFAGMNYVGSSLSITNCVISRNANIDVVALILGHSSTINNMEFNGFAVQDLPGSSYSAVQELLNIEPGSIGQLVLDSLNSTHINLPVSAGGFANIGSVSGAGVLATGWEFPDAVMADGVPYISASTGLPSIKVNGVVKPYP